MATLTTAAVRDNSTLTNFKQWAQIISNFMATAGWLQSGDTGQVNWSTIASVPTAGNYVYEIWKPGDGLTAFYLKIEYGTNAASSNTGPSLRLSVGTSTNGAGTLTGFLTSLPVLPEGAISVTSTVTAFNCYLSGDASRVGIAMWVNDTTNAGPVFFCVERSINASGLYTSDYLTLVTISSRSASSVASFQQSVNISGGAGRTFGSSSLASNNTTEGGLCVAMDPAASSGVAFSSAPLCLVKPQLGLPGNPMTQVGGAYGSDVTEESAVVVPAGNMPYGVSHTYMPLKNTPLSKVTGGTGLQALMMRYD